MVDFRKNTMVVQHPSRDRSRLNILVRKDSCQQKMYFLNQLNAQTTVKVVV